MTGEYLQADFLIEVSVGDTYGKGDRHLSNCADRVKVMYSVTLSTICLYAHRYKSN